MFGGVGIYAGERFFALLAEDRLYLKVDETNRADFEAAGMGPFMPFGHDGFVMQYYEVPLEVIESPAKLGAWASKAIDVAARAQEGKRRAKKRAPTPRKKSPSQKSPPATRTSSARTPATRPQATRTKKAAKRSSVL
jgi:DNA transformation protein